MKIQGDAESPWPNKEKIFKNSYVVKFWKMVQVKNFSTSSFHKSLLCFLLEKFHCE